jgi:pyruvate dehydrogenase E2 component (dihydrolipoamide acetyltransferase)
VDLAAVRAAEGAGVITLDDVLRHAHISPGARAIAAAGPSDGTVEPLRGMRRAMAQSMSLSRDQVAGSTVCDDADIHYWTQRADYMLRLMRAMICARRSMLGTIRPAIRESWSGTSIWPLPWIRRED